MFNWETNERPLMEVQAQKKILKPVGKINRFFP